MNKQDYYELLDNFITRTPSLPFNKYEKIGDINHLKNIISQDDFREAIKIASGSLYESIDKDKLNDDIIKSIMKYYSRIMVRATPFGLFSGVSIGNFDDKSCTSYDGNNINKRIRIDYGWLVKLIKKIEIEYKGYKRLTLYSSRLIEEYGDKIKNQILTCFNFNDELKVTGQAGYINNTSNVIFILNLLRHGAKYEDILNGFNDKNINVKNEVIDKFLEQLIKNEYIYTDLRPPLTEFNTLKYVIEKIESNNIENVQLIDLKKINLLIDKYNKLGNVCGIDILTEIENLMSNLILSKSFIQVDSINPFKITLGENIKKEVTEVCNFLITFSKKFYYNDSLTNFKNEFEERYAEYRDIPILEVIDPTFGIGYDIDNYKNNYVSDKDFKNNFIKQKIADAIKNDEDVVITESDIEKYGNKKMDIKDLPDSMELYFSLDSKDINTLNNGEYKLRIGPNLGSLGAGRNLGRFSDLLPDSNSIYENIKEKERMIIEDEFIQCELLSLDIDPRSMNISITKNFRDFQINITNTTVDNTIKSIDIEDIYVGLENNHLYLKSKKYNKKLKVTTNNMLNTLRSNKVCRLMREISEGNEVLLPFSLINDINLQEARYTPRAIYKNTILANKTWRIYKSEFKSNNITYDEFFCKFELFKNEYKVPNLVYIKQDDLLLLIDLTIDKFKEIVFNKFKQEEASVLILQEADLSSKWLNNNGDYYTNEFVFEFVKKSKTLVNKEKSKNDSNSIYPTISDYKKNKNNNIQLNTRTFGIFSEWIYLKIYHNTERVKELLGSELNYFISELKKENLIEKWFYIRYRDDKDHIRLRLNISNIDKNYVRVLEKVMLWRMRLQQKRLANTIVLDEYERETERYGGEKVIDFAEAVFEIHSLIVSEFLKSTKNKQLEFDEIEFGVCNVINLMNLMGIEYDTQLDIFTSMINKDSMRNDFTPVRKRYVSLFNSDKEWTKLIEDSHGEQKYSILNIGKDVIVKFGERLNEVDKNGELTNSKIDILSSLIHIFCNRLYGIDRDKEKKVRTFTRHTLYAIRYFKRNK